MGFTIIVLVLVGTMPVAVKADRYLLAPARSVHDALVQDDV